MPRYVLVLPLEPLAVPDGFSLSAWPLHVTLVSNFTTELPLDRVVAVLDTGAQPLDVVVGDEALFGPRENVRVRVLEHSDVLADLHRTLVAALRATGAEFDDPGYLDDGYRPHITANRLAQAPAGARLRLSQLALVDMRPDGDAGLRRVVWTAPLGGPVQPGEIAR